jgi:uncharacterized protein (DUF1501 family)
MNRRDLIKAFAALAPITVAGRVWAAPASDARLLVVFLRGAYDAANVLVPVSSDFYYSSRPTLAVARPDVGNPNSALSLTTEWGLHPALRDSIFPLWAKREVAFVPFAGWRPNSPASSRSRSPNNCPWCFAARPRSPTLD